VLLDFAGGPLALSLDAGILLAGGIAVAARRGTSPADSSRLAADRLAVLALWASVPVAAAFAIAQLTPVFLTRYLLFASLAWYLLAGVAAAALPLPRALRAAAALLLAGASLLEFAEGGYRAPDWRAVADRVRRERSIGAVVIVLPGYECLPFGYYLEPELFRGSAELTRALADRGVYCVDAEEDLPQPETPPRRLIQVVAAHAPFGAERMLLRYGSSAYRPIAVERFDRAMVLVHERWGR
jgi:hypothetical protein